MASGEPRRISGSAPVGVLVGPGVLALVLAAVGLQGLGNELSYDEAYTVLCYMLPGAGFALTHYTVPNNHVLYSALVSPLTHWSLEPLWRVPSLLAAALTVWLVGRSLRDSAGVSRRLCWTVVLATFAAFPAFLAYATRLRGYAVAMALVAACLALLLPRPERRGGLRMVAYALSGATAVAVVPTSLLPLASLALFDLGREALQAVPRWRVLARLAIPHVSVLGGLLLYVPMWRELVRNAGLGWGETGWRLAAPVLLALVPPFAVLVVAAAVLRGARRERWRTLAASEPALLSVAVAVTAAASFTVGMRFFPRSFTGFIPLVVAGVVGLALRMLKGRELALGVAALLTALLGQAYWQLSVNWALAGGRPRAAALLLPAEYGARDYDPAEAVELAVASRRPDEPIIVDNRDTSSNEMAVYYYAVLHGAERGIVFAPKGAAPYPGGSAVPSTLVVSRDLAGREGIARWLGRDAVRWTVLKGNGHFKVWRVFTGAQVQER